MMHNRGGNNNVSSSSDNYGIDESKKKTTKKKKTINFPTRHKRGTSMPAPVPANLRNNQRQDRLKKHKSTLFQ